MKLSKQQLKQLIKEEMSAMPSSLSSSSSSSSSTEEQQDPSIKVINTEDGKYVAIFKFQGTEIKSQPAESYKYALSGLKHNSVMSKLIQLIKDNFMPNRY